MSILDNYHNIKNTINSLSKNANLIVVTKNFNMDKIDPIIKAGHINFGENKVQEATYKWTDILKNNKHINLHLLGNLQSNKVPEAVNIFNYIHSLGSEKLANKLIQEENKKNKKLKYFIQINLGDEAQKSGIGVKDSADFIDFCKNQLKLNILGLMCIPPADKDPNLYFSNLKKLATAANLSDLSMGMTHDYVDAIRNGSTYIRIGTGIFGQRL